MAVSKRTRFEVLRRDNYTCRYCRSKDNPLVVDHVTPVALGGSDHPKNLVAACRDCNAGKSSAAPDSPTIEALTDAQIAYEVARARVVAREEKKARAKRKVYQRFIDAWNDCTPTYADPSPDWRSTVSHWLGRGMPIDRIVEAVQIAGRKDHLPATAIYPYMAKIVWNWLTDLEVEIEMEAARRASDEGDGGAVHAACDLLQLHIDGETDRIPAQYRYEKDAA